MAMTSDTVIIVPWATNEHGHRGTQKRSPSRTTTLDYGAGVQELIIDMGFAADSLIQYYDETALPDRNICSQCPGKYSSVHRFKSSMEFLGGTAQIMGGPIRISRKKSRPFTVFMFRAH